MVLNVAGSNPVIRPIYFMSFEIFLKKYLIEDLISSEYFKIAVTHKSISKKNSNERFEFFGDAILNFSISKILLENFPNDSEGVLSKKKSFLISRDLAFKIAIQIKFESFIKIHNIKTEDMMQTNIISCAFEALIAAIYLEYGLEKVNKIIEDLFLPHLINMQDPKTKLQEFCQKKFNLLPEYKLISLSGEDHKPIIKMSLKIMDIEIEVEEKQKKLAEKKLASIMLKKIENGELKKTK